MPSKIPNVHDKFLKELLADRDVAIDFLKELLPEDLLSQIKPETLQAEQTTFLSEELEESFADIVWRIETHTQPIKICLLLEHKSYKDPKVVFQILEYLALGYRHQSKAGKNFELIVPVLYYHGKSTWNFKPFKTYFKGYSQNLLKYLPSYHSEFIDLSKLSTEHLLNLRNGMLSSSLMIQRHYFDNEKLTANIANILRSLGPYLEKNLSNSIFVYLLQYIELNKVILTRELEEIPNEINNKFMSTYDQLINEGMALGIKKGIEQGIEKGIEQGIEKGIEKTILNAFDNGIALETIRLITGETLGKINIVLQNNGRK